jgi:hypothetical protein
MVCAQPRIGVESRCLLGSDARRRGLDCWVIGDCLLDRLLERHRKGRSRCLCGERYRETRHPSKQPDAKNGARKARETQVCTHQSNLLATVCRISIVVDDSPCRSCLRTRASPTACRRGR